METDSKDKNIQSGYKNEIWHRKMSLAHHEKRKKTTHGRNRTEKLERIRKLGEKENQKYIGSGHHQTSGANRKVRKGYLR